MAARELHPVTFFDNRDAGDDSIASVKDFRPHIVDPRRTEVAEVALDPADATGLDNAATMQEAINEAAVDGIDVVTSLVAFAGTVGQARSKRTPAKD